MWKKTQHTFLKHSDLVGSCNYDLHVITFSVCEEIEISEKFFPGVERLNYFRQVFPGCGEIEYSRK